jgi:hypothetical protein
MLDMLNSFNKNVSHHGHEIAGHQLLMEALERKFVSEELSRITL